MTILPLPYAVLVRRSLVATFALADEAHAYAGLCGGAVYTWTGIGHNLALHGGQHGRKIERPGVADVRRAAQ